MKLEGKIITVIGGTRGIGRGIVERCLDEGAAHVVAVSRNTEIGANLLKDLEAGDRLRFLPGDVTASADMDRVLDETVSRYGRLDALVHNAGAIDDFVLLTEMTDSMFEDCIRMNLTGAFFAVRKAGQIMTAQGGGRIVTISSMEAKRPLPFQVHYSAAKAGLDALTKGAAREWGPARVWCNSINVGIVPTDLAIEGGRKFAEGLGVSWEDMIDSVRQEMPSQHLQTTGTIAGLAVYLMSEDAAGVSGACFSVDGGISSH